MQLIKNNPYRTIGLLVGTSPKEQERQVRRLRHLIDAEQAPDDDFSFPILGKLNRTIDSINDAVSKLNLNTDRVNAALFWFYNGSVSDEPAFDAFKDSNPQGAIEIWSKLTMQNEVTHKNSSAYQNFSTYKLNTAFNDSVINIGLLEEGINLKLKFLESDFYKDFIKLSTDETFQITRGQLQKYFLSQVHSEIEIIDATTSKIFLELITNISFSAKQDYLKGFVQKPIKVIENKLNEARSARKANLENAVNIGNTLFEQSNEILSLLKLILTASDIQLSSISDKVSDEVLQCGIDYFNQYRDSNFDPGAATIDLFIKAKTLAIGNTAKQRCEENTLIVQEWVDEKPIREKQQIVTYELKYITDKLEKFQAIEDSINNASSFIYSCKPHLANMKLKLGSSDDLYLKISTSVASNAQGMIISTVNSAMDKRGSYVKYQKYQNDPMRHFGSLTLPLYSQFDKYTSGSSIKEMPYVPTYSYEELKRVIIDAWSVTVALGSLDMAYKQIEHYNKNKESLKALYKQFEVSVIFFGDTPIQKWILWTAGIGLILLIIIISNQ